MRRFKRIAGHPILQLTAIAVLVLGVAAAAAGELTSGERGVQQRDKTIKRALVVLDPGHGGSNTGAPSVREGVFEKHLTLAIARQVRDRLTARGIEVVLTRDRDVYLTLRQRVRRANQLGADLFMSIHANATEAHSLRGNETFVLTPKALDVDGRALRVDDGASRLGLDRDLAAMLDDIERGVVHPIAADWAAGIQEELRKVRGEANDRGVRQDSMHVLLGATMPAVLVEIGFIDHEVEGEEMLDEEVRKSISVALADATASALER